jgi:hypothetical protein
VRRNSIKGEKSDISIEDVYANITKLFHETNIKGVALDVAHQPLLVPIPDFTDMKDMVLLSVTGTSERVLKSVDKKTGTLKITSLNPIQIDMAIYVDGLKRSEPLNTTMTLPEGRHSVELYLPKTGYRHTFVADISASSPLSTVVSFIGELDVASFWLKDGVKSAGPALDVIVDGNRVGKSGLHLDNLVVGTHVLEVKYENVMKSRQVEIRPDSPLRINYSIIREAAPPADVKKIRNVVF